MARIIVTSFGSAGDINPFVALGLGLRERGHDVRFAVEERFRPQIEDAGIAVHHLTGDSEAALAPYAHHMFGKSTPFVSLKYIVEQYILPTLRAKVADLRDACAGADLLVAASAQLAASFVADQTGIPWVSVALSPTLPSAYLEPQPLPFRPPRPLRRVLNRTAWETGNIVLRRMVDRPVNAIRAEYGLPPRHDLLWTGNLSRTLAAVAVSPAFVPRQLDWPSYVRVTGFLFWDTPRSWREPPDLAAFLEGARPVVAVSSGSMAPSTRDAFAQFYATSVDAIRRAGARALIIGAAPGSLPDPLPEDVQALPFAPFSQVYPRCAAIIHHGGIGTTAQGLRTGIPALIVPWGADQFFTAERVRQIGAGLWMPRRRYTSRRAVRALAALLDEPRYRAQAQSIAATIGREDGVGALCDAIENVLHST